jgi:hypothetical protein
MYKLNSLEEHVNLNYEESLEDCFGYWIHSGVWYWMGYIFIKFIISVKQVGHKKAYNRSFGMPIILLCKFNFVFVDFYSNVHCTFVTFFQTKLFYFAILKRD